jgi:curli biogenesis system outer membrane secretion channel CsgG
VRIIPVLAVSCVGLLAVSACAPRVKTKREQVMSANETEKVKSKYTGPKRRIGVVEFENKSGYGQGRLGTAAADVLVTELTKTGKFVVVERDKLNKIMAEQKLQASGIIDPRTAVKVGKILGLNAIVTGAVSESGVKTEGSDYLLARSKKQIAEVVVDIRLVDVETGQVLYADSGSGRSRQTKRSVLGLGGRSGYDETLEGKALRAAIVQFTDNIISQVNRKPWTCRIAAVRGNKVYLNAGSNMGVDKGLDLDCFHLGKKIMDPTTGLVLGHEEEKIGTVEVVGPLGDSGQGSVAEWKRSTNIRAKVGDICRLED